MTLPLLLSFIGGMVPSIIWLIFWLKEDRLHPEPKKYIITTFFAGMLSALVVVLIQQEFLNGYISYSLLTLAFLAFSEEFLKYFFAYFTALRQKFTDEPIDAFIYMITIALGFAAMENILYLWQIFSNGEIVKGMIISNTRFIGATILHITASGIIGVAIALSFCKKIWKQIVYWLIGFILSVALHTSFNFFIINSSKENIFNIFILVWTATILILLLLERIKKLKPSCVINN